MDPQLMGPTSIGSQLHKGEPNALFPRSIVTVGALSIRIDLPLDGGTGGSPNGRVDAAVGRLRASLADSQIAAKKIPAVQHTLQAVMDMAAFCHDHQTRGTSIQPIDRMKGEAVA